MKKVIVNKQEAEGEFLHYLWSLGLEVVKGSIVATQTNVKASVLGHNVMLQNFSTAVRVGESTRVSVHVDDFDMVGFGDGLAIEVSTK